ncbi:MAG: hypothetical protein KDD35_04880 [Bdellovibrionales bacterium]|nr:hypothetical protein [Bdellovibrionales bacterium]
MKITLVLSVFLAFPSFAFGSVPCSIDYGRVTDYLGVVSGTADLADNAPAYITVNNGGLKYTTLTDSAGNWTVTFRYFSTRLNAYSWQTIDGDRTECSDKKLQLVETRNE